MTTDRARTILREHGDDYWTEERIATTCDADLLFYAGQTAARVRSMETARAAVARERERGHEEAIDTRPLDDHGRRVGARRTRV